MIPGNIVDILVPTTFVPSKMSTELLITSVAAHPVLYDPTLLNDPTVTRESNVCVWVCVCVVSERVNE